MSVDTHAVAHLANGLARLHAVLMAFNDEEELNGYVAWHMLLGTYERCVLGRKEPQCAESPEELAGDRLMFVTADDAEIRACWRWPRMCELLGARAPEYRWTPDDAALEPVVREIVTRLHAYADWAQELAEQLLANANGIAGELTGAPAACRELEVQIKVSLQRLLADFDRAAQMPEVDKPDQRNFGMLAQTAVKHGTTIEDLLIQLKGRSAAATSGAVQPPSQPVMRVASRDGNSALVKCSQIAAAICKTPSAVHKMMKPSPNAPKPKIPRRGVGGTDLYDAEEVCGWLKKEWSYDIEPDQVRRAQPRKVWNKTAESAETEGISSQQDSPRLPPIESSA